MNYIIAGMVHAGMDPSHVVSFLRACYLPPIDPNAIEKKEKEMCASLKQWASELCTVLHYL